MTLTVWSLAAFPVYVLRVVVFWLFRGQGIFALLHKTLYKPLRARIAQRRLLGRGEAAEVHALAATRHLHLRFQRSRPSPEPQIEGVNLTLPTHSTFSVSTN